MIRNYVERRWRNLWVWRSNETTCDAQKISSLSVSFENFFWRWKVLTLLFFNNFHQKLPPALNNTLWLFHVEVKADHYRHFLKFEYVICVSFWIHNFQHNFSVKRQREKIARQITLRHQIATRKICQITTRQNQVRILVLILRCEVQNCYWKCQLKKFHCQSMKSTAACSVAFQLDPGVAKESMDTE